MKAHTRILRKHKSNILELKAFTKNTDSFSPHTLNFQPVISRSQDIHWPLPMYDQGGRSKDMQTEHRKHIGIFYDVAFIELGCLWRAYQTVFRNVVKHSRQV